MASMPSSPRAHFRCQAATSPRTPCVQATCVHRLLHMRTSKTGQSDSRKDRQEALGKAVERPASSKGCPYRSRWHGKAWKQPLWKGSISAELELPILTVGGRHWSPRTTPTVRPVAVAAWLGAPLCFCFLRLRNPNQTTAGTSPATSDPRAFCTGPAVP